MCIYYIFAWSKMIFLKKQQLKRLKYFIEYIIARIIFAIIKPFPIGVISPFSNFLGRTLVYFSLKYFQKTRFEIFKRNLKIITKKDATPAQQSALFKKYCSYATTLFLTTINEKKVTKKWLEQNVSSVNMNLLTESHARGEKIIIFSAHFGNWEVAQNYFAKVCNLPLTVIYREQNNAKLSKIFDTRHPNIQMVEKRDTSAMRKMLKSINENRVLIVLLDQRDHTSGTPIEFFGQKAMLPTAMARVAIKSQAKVFACKATASKFEISCDQVFDAKLFANEVELTTAIFATFEKWIVQNPTNWYCLTHNIWK